MATCKGCGRQIIWALNPDTGKRVPLDAVAPVYFLIERSREEGGNECVPAPAHTYVTHFATCSKANEFSGPKKR
jgi:hypothetical protein